MKNIVFLALVSFTLVGCSQAKQSREDTENGNVSSSQVESSGLVTKDTANNEFQKKFVSLHVEGNKLIIDNNYDEAITFLDSKTEFYTRSSDEWVFNPETQSLLNFEQPIFSKESVESDFSNLFKPNKGDTCKVIIFYYLISKPDEELTEELIFNSIEESEDKLTKLVSLETR